MMKTIIEEKLVSFKTLEQKSLRQVFRVFRKGKGA